MSLGENSVESDNTESLEDSFSLEDDSRFPGSNKFGHSYFRDGKRQIDFVLAFTDEKENQEARYTFETSLKDAGLKLEIEMSVQKHNRRFLKIHIPYDALIFHAEIMDLKGVRRKYSDELGESCLKLPRWARPDEKTRHLEFATSAKSMEHVYYLYKYLGDDSIVHSDVDRIRIVWSILKTANYSKNREGIIKLLCYGVYSSAYPLHEGECEIDHPLGKKGPRLLLFSEWAHMRTALFKLQPLELVRSYLGEQIALYFAWMGCYIYMMFFAAVVGLIVFIVNVSYEESKESIPYKDICNSDAIMCSICGNPNECSFVPLNHSCVYAQLSYMVDGPLTVVFAIFMSVWATLFLKIWKREQAILEWRWCLNNVERALDIRPQYELKSRKSVYNSIMMRYEPQMPGVEHALRYIASVCGIILAIVALCSVLYGIVLYRIAMSLELDRSTDRHINDVKALISSVLQYSMVLIVIFISETGFKKFAYILTNFEIPRTRFEYDNSYAFKIIFFEFINYYGILIYTAFFRGKFFSHPGNDGEKDPRRNLKFDLCDASGCMADLFIQLAICMGVRQVILMFYRNIKFFVLKFYRNYRLKHTTLSNLPRWEIDYSLQHYRSTDLFAERLDMVLQYGFVTLFAAAFPLAPVLAFIYNLFEIRLYAFEILVQSRRIIPKKVLGMGVWEGILQGLTYLAVVSNAFLIAFTSDFIPRLVYKMKHNWQLTGYIHEFYLSEFDTHDYGAGPLPMKTCKYIGLRLPPNNTSKYQLSTDYWIVFTARLLFIVIFEHVILVLVGILSYFIPNVPNSLKQRIALERAENLKTRQEILYASRPV